MNHSRRSRVQAANTAPPPEGANRHPLQQITLRVEEAVAWAALDALIHGSCDALPLNQEAETLAMDAEATFDGYEVELDPHRFAIGNRVDLLFVATPTQRRQIIDGLGRRGFDVVEAAPRWGKV